VTVGINSPFRYAGGKFYARKLILNFIPKHSNYLEPFAGGGSIFFAKEKVNTNWLNDIDKELINCYLTIRDYPDQLIEKLQDEKATKERHKYYKNEYQPTSSLERATRWYYLNRTLYSGIRKNRTRIKFLLTYDNSEELRELYNWTTAIHEIEWNYSINRTDDQRKGSQSLKKEKGSRYKGKEIFIINYNTEPIEMYNQSKDSRL